MIDAQWWRWVTMASVLVGSGAFGCGGGVSSASFNPQSVPGDKPIAELDPMEQESFCEEAIEWAEDLWADTLPRLLCRSEGISAGGTETGFDAATCKAAEDACIAMPEELDDVDPDALNCNVDAFSEGCDATVDEFAACLTETTNLSRRFLSELTCDSVAAGQVPKEDDFEISAGCQSLLDRCGGEPPKEDDTDPEPDPPPLPPE